MSALLLRERYAELKYSASFRIGSFNNVNIHSNNDSAQHEQPLPLCLVFLYKSYDSSSLRLRTHL